MPYCEWCIPHRNWLISQIPFRAQLLMSCRLPSSILFVSASLRPSPPHNSYQGCSWPPHHQSQTWILSSRRALDSQSFFLHSDAWAILFPFYLLWSFFSGLLFYFILLVAFLSFWHLKVEASRAWVYASFSVLTSCYLVESHDSNTIFKVMSRKCMSRLWCLIKLHI